jgi:tRNA(Arg) A34 adenosine deaminase TadA
MDDEIARSHAGLPAPVARALDLAWESIVAGSLGIGAVAVHADGTEIATGRNRLIEVDAGSDHLAGSSLAHAELNVLAKLRYRGHEDDDIELVTTLQPCLQCLGAIRLSPVRRVTVLAPDPLWVGVERMRDLTPFVARNWPAIEQVPVSEWSVLALLFPTHQFLFWGTELDTWADRLPRLTELARRLVGDGRLVGLVEQQTGLLDVASELWPGLSDCVVEVSTLAAAEA